MKTVLIIDDEEKLRTLLARIIHLEGFEVLQAADYKTACKKLSQHLVDIVLCDVKLPDANGVEIVAHIKQLQPLTEVILLTAYGNIPDGVQAIKNGAFDYITKGDDNNKIIPLLYKAIDKVSLAKRVQHLEKQLDSKQSFQNIIGQSKAIEQVINLAKKVSTTDATVLLTGETGTGKEVFAQAIHQQSGRNKQNFVAINCAAFSKDLLESELFGHKAGAFTGATKDKKGLFEEAHNGTLFLDEIGEMPLDLQAKLLRVLENGEYIKVGDSKTSKVNVRLIAATNKNLLIEIDNQLFRQDLFYRLSTFSIRLPALRERSSDIGALAEHFCKLFSTKTNQATKTIGTNYTHALINHHWPGNIRELKNVIERSVILSEGPELNIDTLPFELLNNGQTLPLFTLAAAEQQHIKKILTYTNGNKTKTAELLGIALTTLYRKLEEYKIG